MTQRYSSKEQEKFYQPRRLRVLVDEFQTESSYRRASRTVYIVVVQDMATHEVVDTLLWPRYGRSQVPVWDSTFQPPGNWGGRKLTDKAPTKADALKWAKIEARDLELPFDLNKDVVARHDATEGTVIKCLICGKTWQSVHWWAVKERGWSVEDARVCDKCRGQHEIGAALEGERKPYALHGRVVPTRLGLHDRPREEKKDGEGRSLGLVLTGPAPTPDIDFVTVIAGLLNFRVGETVHPHDRDLAGNIGLEKNWTDKPYRVMLTDEQAHWLQELLDLHARNVRTAFLWGKRQGSSLLEMLGRGEVHPDDFADLRDETTNEKKKGVWSFD